MIEDEYWVLGTGKVFPSVYGVFHEDFVDFPINLFAEFHLSLIGELKEPVMPYLLMLTSLYANPEPMRSYSSFASAAESVSSQMQTGTLIFSQGDCLAVKIFTQSSYTHVAAVVMKNGQPYVYDSVSGNGVRRQSLTAYLKSQSPDVVHLMHPSKPFSKERSERFSSYLKEQLGKPYAIKHHLTGKRSEGVHCSEYVTDALMSCRMIHAKQPSRVSPGSLAAGILKVDLYRPARSINLKMKIVKPKGRNWCDQLWIDTKFCTLSCCRQLQRWILCR